MHEHDGHHRVPDEADESIGAWSCAQLLSQVDGEATVPDEKLLSQLRAQTLARFTSAVPRTTTTVAFSVREPSPGPARAVERFIRRSTSLTAACALAAALVLVVGLFTLMARPKHAYGMADVPRLLRSAKTLHVQSFRWAYGPDPQFPSFEKVTLLPMEDWIDLPNVRQHTRSFMSWTPSDTHERHLDGIEIVVNGESRMEVRHGKKKVSFHKRTLLDHRLQARQMVHQTLNILSPDQLGEFQKIGREQIGGKPYDIWERVHQGSDRRIDKDGKEFQKKYTMRVRCWLSPDSGDVGRIEQWARHEPTGMWRPEYFMEKVERDVPIPEERFALTAPDGYEQENTPESPHADWRGAWRAPIGNADMVGYVALTLEDGSVVFGYSAAPLWPDRVKMEKADEQTAAKAEKEWLRKAAAEQEPMLAKLKPGDPVPDLPARVVALRSFSQPYRSAAEVSYTGHHLAYTRFEDRIIEWAVYVPEKKLAVLPPSCVYIMRVAVGGGEAGDVKDALKDFNPAYGDPVVGKDEFDTFLRGSIAERSADGAVPANVTYENVSNLTAEIQSRNTVR